MDLAAWKRMHADDGVDTDDLIRALREAHAADATQYAKTWIPYLATLTWSRRRSDQWYRHGLTAESSLEQLDANRQLAPFMHQTFTLAVASKPKRTKLFDQLIASPLLAYIDELVLTNCKLGDDAIIALCNSPKLSKLSVLRVGSCTIGDDGVRALATLPTVTRLELTDNAFSNEALVALMTSTHGKRLVELDVGSNVLEPPAVEAIARGPKLEVLRLGATELGDAGVKALTRSLAGSLVELELVHNDLTATTGTLLASTPKLASLRKLSLFDNALADAGVKALAASKYLAALTHLDLGKNRVTKTGAHALASASSFESLIDLSLDNNALANDGVAAIAKSTLPALATLSLRWTKATEAGALALTEASLPSLRRLELTGNKIGTRAAAALRAIAGLRVSL
jgi:Ran GTPase-activating protein (RanGAP) involved in mRNA processing and transport